MFSQRHKIIRRSGFLASLLLLLLLCGCGRADISAYEDTPITIAGLTEETFSVTPKELAALPCVSRTATGATAKAGTVSACGPLLDTFLAQYGCKAADFRKIRFLCADGYKVVLKGEYLTEYEVVLSVSSGKQPLEAAQQPLRILIPEAESGMWAYSVLRMEFER